MEIYFSAWQATGDNMAHAHCMQVRKTTDTHSEYEILIAFRCTNGCMNAPQC